MKYVFFDLDGTVTDSAPGILNSVRYAIKKTGAMMPDDETLLKFVGPPLSDSFVRYCGVAPEKTPEVIACFREYFTVKGMYENSLYPGIRELLEKLRCSGKKVILATSKPQVFSEKILTHFGVRELFDGVYGDTLDGRFHDKGALLREIISREGIGEEGKRDCVMVGDRKNDVEGAKAAGIRSIGVLYGYGDLAELTGAGADIIAGSVEELEAILTRQ